MYRCCVPGCGGAILNSAKIRQSFRPHCSAYHNNPALIYVFHFELQRGWDLVSVPTAKKGEPIPGFRMPQGEENVEQRSQGAELLDMSLAAYKGNKGPNIKRTECYLKGRDKVKGKGQGQKPYEGSVGGKGKWGTGSGSRGDCSGVFCFAAEESLELKGAGSDRMTETKMVAGVELGGGKVAADAPEPMLAQRETGSKGRGGGSSGGRLSSMVSPERFQAALLASLDE